MSCSQMTTLIAFAVAGIAIPVTTPAAVIINPTFTDSVGQTWDATRTGVVNQAIADWSSLLSGVDDGAGGTMSVTINVDFDFTTGFGYLGQWDGEFTAFPGTDIRAWSPEMDHTIHFNADLFTGPNTIWWDPTPTDDGSDKPFADWDALTVARHEVGHMLGFNDLYVDDFSDVNESSPWTSLIDANDIFDPGGLNVPMEPGDPGHVLQDSLLMDTTLSNAEGRIGISDTELQMLSRGYGYQAVPEPSHFAVVGLLLLFAWRHRRRDVNAATELSH